MKIQTSVPIGIDQSGGEQGNGLFVGRVVDVTPGRPPEERQQRDVIIPAGKGRFGKVDLKPGEYIIEALMPGGELLDRRVSVDATGIASPVLLARRGLLGGELGWQAASGNVHQASLKSELSALREILQPTSSAAATSSTRMAIYALLPVIIGAIISWIWPQGDTERATRMPAPIEMEASNSAATVDEAIEAADSASDSMDGGEMSGNASASYRRLPSAPTAAGRIKAQAAPAPEAAGGGMEAAAANGWFGLPLWGIAAIIAGLVGLGGLGWFFFRPRRRFRYRTLARRPPEAAPPMARNASAAASEVAGNAILFRLPAASAWALIEAAEQGGSAVHALIGSLPNKAKVTPRAGEGFSFYDIGADAAPVRQRGGALFAFVPSAGSAGELVAVPMPWRLAEGGEASFEIAASANAETSFSTGSAIKDRSITTIAGYMSAGRLREAELLVRSASNLLNHKYYNEMAAVLGAYVLLATCQTSASGPNWRPWIENLHRDFPALPDGAILQGWNLLQTQTNEAELNAALACFLEAVGRGIPLYAEGVRLLQSGLAMFAKRKENDPRIGAAIAKADLLATRCNPSQAFTTIRISSQP